MELHEALRQIDVIRSQVARTEVFRGYKAATVAATGLLGITAAVLQPLLVPDPAHHLSRYLMLWVGVAGANLAIVTADLWLCWQRNSTPLVRKQTLRAIEQFAPCLLAGAAATWAIVRCVPEAASALPGLWAILFSLGLFASWRQVTPLLLVVAVHYLISGVACLLLAGEHAYSPWTMAGTFGIGQLLTAVMLHLTPEARHAKT